jgi:hypothetical protein
MPVAFIRLTRNDGREILVNPITISSVVPHGTGARISFPGEHGCRIDVRETVAAIGAALDARHA